MPELCYFRIKIRQSKSNYHQTMAKEEDKKPSPLTKDDFYLNEIGLMVFTETYHLKRGYCCKNGCKHCPFKKK